MRACAASLAALASCTLFASWAGAQDGAASMALPLALRGFVHREVFFGCGEAWTDRVASTQVTLSIDAHRRAHLRVEAHVVDATGGVSLLDSAPYHDGSERSLDVDWTGRARREHGALVIALDALVERTPVAGAESTIVVTSRAHLVARLTCERAEHDLFAPSRPPSLDHEPATARRAITACTFEPTEHEGPLPRPVRDALTPTFFLDEGAGVTTDASYRGDLTGAPEIFVARERAGSIRAELGFVQWPTAGAPDAMAARNAR